MHDIKFMLSELVQRQGRENPFGGNKKNLVFGFLVNYQYTRFFLFCQKQPFLYRKNTQKPPENHQKKHPKKTAEKHPKNEEVQILRNCKFQIYPKPVNPHAERKNWLFFFKKNPTVVTSV